MESWHISSVETRESALISRQFMVLGAFSSCCAEIGVPLDLRQVSRNLWSCLKKVKPLALYDMARRLALEPIQGNRASSWVDLGCNKLFHIPAVT